MLLPSRNTPVASFSVRSMVSGKSRFSTKKESVLRVTSHPENGGRLSGASTSEIQLRKSTQLAEKSKRHFYKSVLFGALIVAGVATGGISGCILATSALLGAGIQASLTGLCAERSTLLKYAAEETLRQEKIVSDFNPCAPIAMMESPSHKALSWFQLS